MKRWVVVLLLCGCSTVTHDKQVKAVIAEYLPPNTTVNIMSLYDLRIKHNRHINGIVRRVCDPVCRYTIDSINDPSTVLHEFCHVLDWDFHKGYKHSGLQGCQFFNFDTINGLKL